MKIDADKLKEKLRDFYQDQKGLRFSRGPYKSLLHIVDSLTEPEDVCSQCGGAGGEVIIERTGVEDGHYEELIERGEPCALCNGTGEKTENSDVLYVLDELEKYTKDVIATCMYENSGEGKVVGIAYAQKINQIRSRVKGGE